MTWGDDRDSAIKRLLTALLTFRLEGVNCNVALLRGILAYSDFIQSVHHTGTLAGYLENRGQRCKTAGANGQLKGDGKDKGEKQMAAAIGAALALSLQSVQLQSAPAAAGAGPWRVYGRREQMLSRTLGSRGWR